MADLLETGGNDQEIAREQSEFVRIALGRLMDMGKGLIDFAQRVDQWAKTHLEAGNKLLLPETATVKDVQQVETALQDPQNATVEVNAVSQTEGGEIVRQPVADPWDEEISEVVTQAMDQLDEPAETETVAVEAVIDNSEPVQTETQDQKPLVNEFIEKAGESLQQQTNEFLTQAEQFIQENVQVTIEPMPQQDGSLAMSVDKPSLLAQMSLAGGNFAQVAKEEMQKLAPQQFEQVSQAVKNTQEKVQGAISQVSETVLERLNDPPLSRHIDDLESRIGGELSDIKLEMNELRSNQYSINDINGEVVNEFKAEVSALRSQVGSLESQISTLEQQQAKTNEMLAALEAKPPLNNPKLNSWQQSFTNNVKVMYQNVSQQLGEKINQLKTQVQGVLEKFKQNIGQRLQPLVDRLRPVVIQAQNLRADVIDGYHQTRQTVGQTFSNAMKFVGEKASDLQVAAINKSADHLFAQHGQSVEGGQVYEGDKYRFHRDTEGTLTITGRDLKTIYQNGEFNAQVPKEDRAAIVGATQQISENLEKKEANQQKQTAQKKQAPAQQERPKAVAAARRR